MSRRPDDRRLDFKFLGLTNDEMRRRREETTIELRKSKREDSLSKRRNIVDSDPNSGLAFTEETLRQTASNELNAEQYVAPLMSTDYELIHNACQGFRRILSKEQNPPIAAVVQLNVVPRLVELLSGAGIPSDCPSDVAEKIIFESAWALTNIASGESHHTLLVVQAHAVPIFVQLLKSTNKDIREQSIWALGNISGDSSNLRDYVLQCNVMMNLLQVIIEESSNAHVNFPLLRNAVWTASNLCRNKPPPPWDQTPTLRALGNIVTGDDDITQAVVDLGVLRPLKALMMPTAKSNLKKEACWVVSNITAGTAQQIKAVFDHGIMPELVDLLAHADYKTKKEACWAICNASSCGDVYPEIIRYLVGKGVIRPLVNMLTSEEPKILQVTLDGIENILAVGENDAAHSDDNVNQFAIQFEDANGLEMLWDLQSHMDTNVYLKAKNIVQKFFSDDDQEIHLDISAGQKFSF